MHYGPISQPFFTVDLIHRAKGLGRTSADLRATGAVTHVVFCGPLRMAIICARAEEEHERVLRRTSGLYVLEDVFVKALQASDFLWVKFIDPYGDTVLNCLQIPHFLDEWNRLSAFQSTDAEARALQDVRESR